MDELTQQILSIIKSDNNADGIDMAIALNTSVAEVYEKLYILQQNNLIQKEYYGIRTGYSIK